MPSVRVYTYIPSEQKTYLPSANSDKPESSSGLDFSPSAVPFEDTLLPSTGASHPRISFFPSQASITPTHGNFDTIVPTQRTSDEPVNSPVIMDMPSPGPTTLSQSSSMSPSTILPIPLNEPSLSPSENPTRPRNIEPTASIRPTIAIFPDFTGLPTNIPVLFSDSPSSVAPTAEYMLPTSFEDLQTIQPSVNPKTQILPTTTTATTVTPSLRTFLPSTNSDSQLVPTATVVPSVCIVRHPDWVGDGWCDSSNGLGINEGYNSALCDYDGGDCCEETCVSTELHECGRTVMFDCIDPTITRTEE